MYNLPIYDGDNELHDDLYQLELIDQEDQEEAFNRQLLENQIKPPATNLFQLDFSEIQEQVNPQPHKSVQSIVDQMLFSISNNEVILGNQVVAEEEEIIFEDTFEDFEFREYQIELYEKGIGKNSIIYLETGLGKTLVIMMLMWDRITKFPNKKIVFLANTIQLVEQQGLQISRKLPKVAELLSDDDQMVEMAKKMVQNVKIIHGNKCADHWNSMMWQLILDENQIFAMTTQIFLNILRKGLRKLEDFCFIAMDECHNAVCDHPYNFILREFYFPQDDDDIKIDIQIVGSTASPVMNNKSVTDEQLVKELIQLASNLNSQYLYTDAESVKKHLSEAQIVPVYYSILFNDLDIQKVIDGRCSLDQCVRGQNRVFDTMKRYNYLPEFFELQRCIELFKRKFSDDLQIQIILQQIQKQMLSNGFQMYLELGQYIFVLLLQFVIQKMSEYFVMKREKLNDLYYLEIKRSLEVLYSQVSQKYDNIYTSVTPKVQKLFDILKQAYTDQGKNNMTLVFVKQRVTAYFLNQLLEQYFKIINLDSDIQSDFIIGINSKLMRKSTVQSSVTQIDVNPDDEEVVIKQLYNELQKNQSQFSVRELKDQVAKLSIFKQTINSSQSKEKLQKFRNGKIKILISTSVAEEGIDIPMCNLVIGFNPIASSKAYVQMKGRARKEKSKFLIFMVQKNESQARLQCHQQVQKNTKKLISELSQPQRQESFKMAITKLWKNNLKNCFYDKFDVPETGACVNTNWSCQLIQQFCQCVILEGHTKAIPRYAIYQFKSSQKNQESQYLAFLQLPMQLKQFIFYGDKTSNPKDAKASAALQAARQLYLKGFLDSTLRPVLNSGFGQHIGADSDDSQIMMSREQYQISSRFSLRIIEKNIATGVKVNSQKRYYTNKQKQFFIAIQDQEQQQKVEYIQQTCIYNNETYLIFLPKILLKQLIDYNLKLVGFNFKEIQSISEKTYFNYYQKYIQNILEEENLIKTINNTYSTLNKYYQIRVKEMKENYGNFMFMIKQSDNRKIKLSQVVSQMILGLQVNEFKDKLTVQLKQNLYSNTDYLDSTTNSCTNTILVEIEKYYQQITPIQMGIVSNISDSMNYSIIYSVPKQNKTIDIFQSLEQILLQSLNLDQPNYNDLLIGSQYYNFLISLTVYANYKNDDSRIAKSKVKTALSSTYVRNCLLENYVFLYLHKTDYEDFAKLLVGINRYLDDDDGIMRPQLDDNFIFQYNTSVNKQVELQNKVYFSNQEFYQFLEKSLKIIEEEDFDQSIGLLWIKTLQLTSNLKIKISNSKILCNYIPNTLLNNEYRNSLQKLYNVLEQQIKYKFKSFELLFQAMTDISFKYYFNNKVKYKYITLFQTKEEFQGILSELELDQLKKEFDIMNNSDSSNYENSSLTVLGQAIWSYGIVKLLVKRNFDPYTVRILGKLLKDTPFLAFAAIRFKLHLFLNNACQKTIFEIAKQTERCQDQSIAFHISSLSFNQNTEILENGFLALVAAIFLDSGCEISIIFQWQQKILNELQIEQLLSPSYYQRHPKYKFYKWYESNIGNPFDFNLIKIPHQDYKKSAQGEFLFIPYDMKTASIVNIKRDKYYEISQLHIYAKQKSQAWDKLYEMIDY